VHCCGVEADGFSCLGVGSVDLCRWLTGDLGKSSGDGGRWTSFL
jgi:hypothetical protein